MLASLEFLLYLFILIITLICIGAVAFFERKSPTSSIAWIMVLAFLPVIGVLAYFFFGNGFRINKKKKYEMKAINDSLYDHFLRKHLNIGPALKFMAAHESAARLMTYLHKGGEAVYTSDNHGEVFTDGNDLFPRMIEDLKKAQSHIHLLYFIFNNDRIGREIADILTAKAKEGVEVRLIYDSVGSRAIFSPPIFRQLRKAGGQVVGFSPIASNLNADLRLNYRNHRKIAVIDGRVGYLGGMNIGDEYMSRKKRLSPWRDTHLRLTGSSVWFLQERFLMDWGYTSNMELNSPLNLSKFFPVCDSCGQLGVQIVSSGPDTAENPIKSGLLTMLHSARKNIYLQSPYFSPDGSLMDALRIAAGSGVDVRLMLPILSDHWLTHMAALGYARQVLDYGVRIFLYQGFIHAKTAVSDGLVTTIGSSNINNRSYIYDFEVNAFIYDQGFAAKYEEIFLADQARSLELTPQWFEEKNGWTRSVYNFARLFAPLM